MNIYYGKCLALIQHDLADSSKMLVLATWVDRGLRVGKEKQVYADYVRDSRELFSTVRIESAHCVYHQMSVVEAKKEIHKRRFVKRSYFIDELRGTYRGIGHLAASCSDDDNETPFRLMGTK